MPPSKSKRKKKILSKPKKIEPSFPISAEIANLDSTITIDHNLYINHGYHECMSKCKKLCKSYENMKEVSDTVSYDSGKGKLLNQRKHNKNGLRDDMAINKQSCTKERQCANEKENVRMTNKVENVSDTKYMVPWSRKELLDNLDIRYEIPENWHSGFGGLEKMIMNLGNDTMKMCPYTPNGMKKKRDFNNRFVRLNQFELPKDNIQYGINLVNVRKNFLNAVFPDIIKIENKSFWKKMFGGEDDKEITENEPSLFAIRLLEIISTKRYQKPFLKTPIKHKKYSSRLNKLIENSFLENIEFIEYHELFIICLLYIQKHLKGIIKREFYECLNVVASEKSGRIYLFLDCIPYVLGNLKYSMMMNLFKCLLGYAGEFNVSQEYVFKKTCRYLVDEKVKDVRHEPISKLCNIMMKDQQKT